MLVQVPLRKYHFNVFSQKLLFFPLGVSQLKSDSDCWWNNFKFCVYPFPWPRSRKWLLIFRTGLCSNTFHWFTYFICNFYFNLAEFETLLYYVSKILFSHRCDFGFKYNCICKHHKDLSSVCLCVDLTTFSDLGSTRRRWWGAWALIHKLSLKKIIAPLCFKSQGSLHSSYPPESGKIKIKFVQTYALANLYLSLLVFASTIQEWKFQHNAV